MLDINNEGEIKLTIRFFSSSLGIFAFSLFIFTNDAFNLFLPRFRLTSTSQLSFGIKEAISLSRSTINFKTTERRAIQIIS